MDKDGYHGYDEPVIDESAAKRIATALGWEPKREWVGLTSEEIAADVKEHIAVGTRSFEEFARRIEASLKEKNE